MNTVKLAVMTLVGAAIIVIGLSAFTVNEREMAIKLQLGEVVRGRIRSGPALQMATRAEHPQISTPHI